jgi:carbamoylphosphate synthase small subunit
LLCLKWRFSPNCALASHWNAKESLSAWMQREGVPGIYGIDTRAVTKRLRTTGSLKGKIVIDGVDPNTVSFEDPNLLHLAKLVSIPKIREHNPQGDVKILIVDVGIKNNQIRCFVRRGAHVKV